MTRTGRILEEYINMGAAGLVALVSFIQCIPIDSELYKEMNPKDEFSAWSSVAKTNAILADIYDVYAKVHTKKGAKQVYYPRPKTHKSIGRDAIPLKDFWNWWKKEN